MVEFQFQEMFPLVKGDTPYRKVTGDHVSVGEYRGNRILEVDREALTLLAAESIRDISHLFRPGHLSHLRAILDDPAFNPEWPEAGPSRDQCRLG